MNKLKLTKTEKRWVLYDIGNSAFILLVATLLPIYFNSLAKQAGVSESDYLASGAMQALSLPFWWPSSVLCAARWLTGKATKSPFSWALCW